MHAAYRWYSGLTFSGRIPDRSAVIKLCKDNWATVDVFSSMISRVVQQCFFCDLVKAEHLFAEAKVCHGMDRARLPHPFLLLLAGKATQKNAFQNVPRH